MKSDEEIAAAVEALRAWFVSQDLLPSEAGSCLTKLIAQQLVANNPDIEALNLGITLFHNQLTMEVATQLEANRDTSRLQ